MCQNDEDEYVDIKSGFNFKVHHYGLKGLQKVKKNLKHSDFYHFFLQIWEGV